MRRLLDSRFRNWLLRPYCAFISIRSKSVHFGHWYTHMIRKQTTFSHTEALASHPRRCKLRMSPKHIPTTMKIIMHAIKQMLSLANWEMIVPQLRISTATVMNCCSDCVTLIKWREFLPYTRKKVSP